MQSQVGQSPESPPTGGPMTVLAEFDRKCQELLNRRKTELSTIESQWMRTFNRVAAKFDCFTKNESYSLSLAALHRCLERGNALSTTYVKNACRNEHLNYVRSFGRPQQEPHALAFEPETQTVKREVSDDLEWKANWAGIDERLDFEEAVSKIGVRYPKHAKLLLMRRDGRQYGEIAKAIEVGEWHVYRIAREAEEMLRSRLGDYYS